MNKKPTNFKETNRHPSQNDLPPIDKFHPDWWYYREEMDEPVEIDNVYKNESKHMNKKLIRLTESDLHRIVKESVNRILRESIDPWEDAVYKHYTRERLPKGWERIDREDDEPIYRDPDFNEYVKDEYGNFKLI